MRSFLRPQFFVDLVTFTEEILNETLHFLCKVMTKIPAGNKTKRYSPVYHSMKTYHHQFVLIRCKLLELPFTVAELEP